MTNITTNHAITYTNIMNELIPIFYIRYNFIKVLWFLCITLRQFAGFNSILY